MKVRWTIFLFLGGFAMLAYVQRTSLGVAAQNIMPDLHLSQLQIGWLNAAFATCYTLAQMPGGVLGQRLRRAAHVHGRSAWSASSRRSRRRSRRSCWQARRCSSHCSPRRGCSASRRGRCFRCSPPCRRPGSRSGNGRSPTAATRSVMNIGGAMTAPLIVVLTAHYGWQGALLWIALPAVLLTASWAWYGRDRPAEHPRVTAAELAELDASDMAKPAPMTLARMRQIVGQRDVRLLTFAVFLPQLSSSICWAPGRSCTWCRNAASPDSRAALPACCRGSAPALARASVVCCRTAWRRGSAIAGAIDWCR